MVRPPKANRPVRRIAWFEDSVTPSSLSATLRWSRRAVGLLWWNARHRGRLVKELFRYPPDRRLWAAFASLRLVCFLDEPSHIFQTTLETIPSEVPYLGPRHLVQPTPGKPVRVGLGRESQATARPDVKLPL